MWIPAWIQTTHHLKAVLPTLAVLTLEFAYLEVFTPISSKANNPLDALPVNHESNFEAPITSSRIESQAALARTRAIGTASTGVLYQHRITWQRLSQCARQEISEGGVSCSTTSQQRPAKERTRRVYACSAQASCWAGAAFSACLASRASFLVMNRLSFFWEPSTSRSTTVRCVCGWCMMPDRPRPMMRRRLR